MFFGPPKNARTPPFFPAGSYFIDPLTGELNNITQRTNCILQALRKVYGAHFDTTSSNPTKRFNEGGHLNIYVETGSLGPGQVGGIQQSVQQNSFVPPGSRTSVSIDTINGPQEYALHLPAGITEQGGVLTGRAHLDVGNPNRDVVGMLKHFFIDYLKGQTINGNLDPRCNST